MSEKFRITKVSNRLTAGLGALLAAGGLVTTAWGWESKNAADAVLSNDEMTCSYVPQTDACDRLPADNHDMSDALQLIGDGIILGVIGGSAIYLAYVRDKKAADPSTAELSFEEELALVLENKISSAADVPKEI